MLGMAYVHYIRCNNCSRYDMYLGSITVAAAHELEYEAQSGILCSTKVTNGNSLRVILSLQVRSILESEPISGLPRGLQYPYHWRANQADVCYCINLQGDMGVNMGMYNGVQSTLAF